MKHQTFINSSVKTICIALFSLFVLVSSCSKERDSVGTGRAVLKVSVRSADFAQLQSPMQRVASTGKAIEMETVQYSSVQFNNEYRLVARLIPQLPASGTPEKGRVVSSDAKGVGLNALALQVDNALAANTKYRVVAYDSDGNYVDDVVYSVGSETTEDFALNAGETYTFISFSTGSTTTVPGIDVGQPLSDAVLSGLNGNEHFMLYTTEMRLTSGVNNLDIILKHQFSQITTVINGTAIGNVTAVVANITPHHPAADIKLSNGAITYTGAAGSNTVSFSTLGSSTVTSDPTIVCASTVSGTFTLSSITVEGIEKTGLVLEDLKITPGVRYQLVLTLTPGDGDGGIEIGGSTWASGNLVYDVSTLTYGFAATNDAYGNYFFPDYLLPKRFDVNNQNPSAGLNGGSGDPCALVMPLNSWRLPKVQEFNSLVSATDVNGADNPGVPSLYAPARFQEKYNGTGNVGLFFGTQVSPGSDYENYLYLPYGGSYNDNNSGGGFGVQGYYILSTPSGYNFLHLTGVWSANPNLAASTNYAVQIRCVKNEVTP